MGKRLFIHIGGMKTGTTSLQVFLAKNRDRLKARGFCYPGTAAAQWDICGDISGRTSQSLLGRISGPAITRHLSEILQSPCHTAVVSGECLSFPGGDPGILRDLIPKTLPVAVVYYARRQDFLAESYYLQTVKARFHHTGDRLDDRYLSALYRETILDHSRILAPWADAFGKENVIVRCYEKQQMNGDIIRDFASVIGLNPDEGLLIQKGRRNSSMDLPVAEFIRLCNAAFPDSLDISKYLFYHNTHNIRLVPPHPKNSLLSPSARREILERSEESNRRVAREYLGRPDGRLFFDPLPDTDEPWTPGTGLSAEDLGQIIGEIIQNTGENLDQMEPVSSLIARIDGAFRNKQTK